MQALLILSSPSEACEGCGACCMHIASPPYTPEEAAELEFTAPEVYRDFELAKYRRDSVVLAGKSDEIPCAFLDMESKRCRNYEHRPKICRDFKVGCWQCEWVVIMNQRWRHAVIVEYMQWCNSQRGVPAAPLIAALVIVLFILEMWS
jgi:Fe-S-cluster containining protein